MTTQENAQPLCHECHVAKTAKGVKSKAGFISAALGSVFSVELLAGAEERVRLKERKQPSLFRKGSDE